MNKYANFTASTPAEATDFGTKHRMSINVNIVRDHAPPVAEIKSQGDFNVKQTPILRKKFDFDKPDLLTTLQEYVQKHQDSKKAKRKKKLCALIEGGLFFSSMQTHTVNELKFKSTTFKDKDPKKATAAASYSLSQYDSEHGPFIQVPCLIKINNGFSREAVTNYTDSFNDEAKTPKDVRKKVNCKVFFERKHLKVAGVELCSTDVVTKFMALTLSNVHVLNKVYGDTTDEEGDLKPRTSYNAVASILVKRLCKFSVPSAEQIKIITQQTGNNDMTKYDPSKKAFGTASWDFDPKTITIIGIPSVLPSYARGSAPRAVSSTVDVITKEEAESMFDSDSDSDSESDSDDEVDPSQVKIDAKFN